MNLSTIYLIYSGIGILALVSIVLATFNWIKLASTSSKINELQADIDKKTREFDAIKKENAESKKQIASQQNIGNVQNQQSPKIEIVRNIREEYSDFTAQNKFEPGKVPYFAGEQSDSPQPQDMQLDQPQEPVKAVDTNEAPIVKVTDKIEEKAFVFGPDKNGDDVLDVIDEEKGESSIQSETPDSIIIPLYSQSLDYADFGNLWNLLSQALESPQKLPISIDLTNIATFNEKEIEYLQKICQIAEYKNGTVTFINYNDKLSSILSQDTTLCNFIRKV